MKIEEAQNQLRHLLGLDVESPAPVVVGPVVNGPPKLTLILGGASQEKKMPTNRPTTVRRVTEYLGPKTDIQPDALAGYEKQGGWIVEPKMDGMWAVLKVGSPKDGIPNVLNSRDARTPSISGSNLGDLDKIDLGLPPGTLLVGELEAATQHAKLVVEKQGYRRLHVFDIVRLGDQSMTHLKWMERRDVLTNIHASIVEEDAALRFPLLPFVSSDFRGYYDHVVARGEEGIVLKRRDSTYETNTTDGKTGLWLRCKKWVTSDFVLMGTEYTPGGKTSAPKLTGVWGLYNSKGELTRVMGAPAKPESLHLNKDNHGVLVAEFMGWGHMKSGALRHAQFVRVRTDKPREDCKL